MIDSKSRPKWGQGVVKVSRRAMFARKRRALVRLGEILYTKRLKEPMPLDAFSCLCARVHEARRAH